MKLRVGVLTNIPSPYQVELFDAIARRGEIDLKVWYCAAQDTRRMWGGRRLAHAHRIGGGWRIKTPREHWYIDPRPAVELVRWKPDVAVLQGYAIPAIQLGMWCATLTAVPWVYWGEAVASGGNAFVRRTGRNAALFAVRRWAAGFFAVGEKGVENFRALLSAHRPIFKMPYFSNLARFQPQPGRAPSHESPTFLYVGSFIRRKGVDILARAFSEVAQEFPRARLLIAGDGDARDLFDSLLSEPAASRVSRAGFVPWEDLPDLYRRADYLVMPSRYDGWGLVIPEAMASGLPVIGSTAAGATLDLVRAGVTGWPVPPADVAALAAAMRQAASLDPDTLTEMRRHCLVRARRFDATVGARVFARAAALVLDRGRSLSA